MIKLAIRILLLICITMIVVQINAQDNEESGDWSTAIGNNSEASGDWSTATGYYSEASGDWSTATGYYSEASGDWSTASGNNSNASGDWSTAIGSNTNAVSDWEIAIGRWNTSYSPSTKRDWDSSDRLFGIGNGTGNGSRSDAVIVLKNGNVGIGTSTPESAMHVEGEINLNPITAPASPTTGFIIYVDSFDGALKAKASTGKVTVLARD